MYSPRSSSVVLHLHAARPCFNPAKSDSGCGSLTAPPPAPQTVSLQELQQDFENASPTDPNNNQTPADGASVSYITFSPDSSPAAHCEPPASAEIPIEPSDMLASVPPFVTFHTLILDMSGVSFVDLMGIKALAKVRPWGRGSAGPPPASHPRTCSPTLPFLGAFTSTS